MNNKSSTWQLGQFRASPFSIKSWISLLALVRKKWYFLSTTHSHPSKFLFFLSCHPLNQVVLSADIACNLVLHVQPKSKKKNYEHRKRGNLRTNHLASEAVDFVAQGAFEHVHVIVKYCPTRAVRGLAVKSVGHVCLRLLHRLLLVFQQHGRGDQLQQRHKWHHAHRYLRGEYEQSLKIWEKDLKWMKYQLFYSFIASIFRSINL